MKCSCYEQLTFLIGTNFAEITSQGMYSILSGNEVFYADTTLACATNGTSQPQWNHKENQNANSQSLAATSWNLSTGISTLDITITQYGYYTCTPISGTTYTVSIYDLADTIGKTLPLYNLIIYVSSIY